MQLIGLIRIITTPPASGLTFGYFGETSTWDYTYDADGQLTAVKENGVDEELYAYDVNGNRKSYEQPGAWSILADYDEQDRLVQVGGTAYQFNADGQLTQRGTDTFQYSAQGELLQATVAGQTITYTYDGTGRRVARTDSTGTTQYLYGNQSNPFQLTASRDAAGVLSTFYYDNAGSLFAFDKGGVRYYVASDQVGTPKAVSDATGAVVKFLGYDSFGMPTFDSNPDLSLPVGFAGGLTDDKTGLVRFGYRDYEPGAGRWTAKDPIFFKGGQGNLYVYVQNRPVGSYDPSGLSEKRGFFEKLVDILGFRPLTNEEIESIDWSKVETQYCEISISSAASERMAKDMAKQIERDLGKEARRLFHDLESVADRTVPELKEDARYVYEQANKLGLLPKWMK